MRSLPFEEGVQAIQWTIEDRGLAGLSDLDGIPWAMPMELFFEAWAETVLQLVGRRTGGTLKTGRKRETVRPITWSPPYLGSQKSLIPDLWLQWQDTTLIVDAKYKRHWEEIHDHPWSTVEQKLREEHRSDLLQVLAYGNLASTGRIVVCLAYPCSSERWRSLLARDQLFHRAELTVGEKSISLWLTAVPMGISVEEAAAPIEAEVRNVLRA